MAFTVCTVQRYIAWPWTYSSVPRLSTPPGTREGGGGHIATDGFNPTPGIIQESGHLSTTGGQQYGTNYQHIKATRDGQDYLLEGFVVATIWTPHSFGHIIVGLLPSTATFLVQTSVVDPYTHFFRIRNNPTDSSIQAWGTNVLLSGKQSVLRHFLMTKKSHCIKKITSHHAVMGVRGS